MKVSVLQKTARDVVDCILEKVDSIINIGATRPALVKELAVASAIADSRLFEKKFDSMSWSILTNHDHLRSYSIMENKIWSSIDSNRHLSAMFSSFTSEGNTVWFINNMKSSRTIILNTLLTDFLYQTDLSFLHGRHLAISEIKKYFEEMQDKWGVPANQKLRIKKLYKQYSVWEMTLMKKSEVVATVNLKTSNILCNGCKWNTHMSGTDWYTSKWYGNQMFLAIDCLRRLSSIDCYYSRKLIAPLLNGNITMADILMFLTMEKQHAELEVLPGYTTPK